MASSTNFPIFRALTGRRARRVYFVILLFLLLLTSAFRLRTYLMARKIQAVLRELAQIRIDQTTEEQLAKIAPELTRRETTLNGVVYRSYYADISNEHDWRIPGLMPYGLGAPSRLADWLGYRYVSFEGGASIENGKVTFVSYGLTNVWSRPQYEGYVGYKVSARSVHSFWLPREMSFEVTSVADQSPQYRPEGGDQWLNVLFTADAPPALTAHAFQLDLNCFWSLSGCDDAREIAPAMWSDLRSIQAASNQQLSSGKCPDSIVEGRMRYLPDISVLLLEVTGSRQVEGNEEGRHSEELLIDYKLKEVLRGRAPASDSWTNVRLRPQIPSPEDPMRLIGNPMVPETKIGSPVLFFGTQFDSCRFIPATPSALAIVRNTPAPPKRGEDEIPRGLQ